LKPLNGKPAVIVILSHLVLNKLHGSTNNYLQTQLGVWKQYST